MAKVSVVMPVYNAGEFLEECAGSVLAQTLRDIEVVCVDDGSEDDSVAILERMAADDPRLKVIRRLHTDAGSCRNAGYAACSGEYVLFLDADDVFAPAMFEEMVCALDQSKADVAICDRRDFSHGSPVPKLAAGRQKWSEIRTPAAKTDIFDKWFGWPWDKMFRKGFIDANKLSFQPLRSSNDLLFVFSALSLAGKIVETEAPFVAHRKHNASIERTRDKNPLCCISALSAYWQSMAERGVLAANPHLAKCLNAYALEFLFWNLDTMRTDETYATLKSAMLKLLDEMLPAGAARSDFGKMAPLYDRYRKLKTNTKPDFPAPELSIVIPLYQAQKTIRPLLESIVAAAAKRPDLPYEVVAVDDGSTDLGAGIVREFGEEHPMRVVRQENAGPAIARNNGIEHSRGRYVWFIDSDDSIKPDSFALLADKIRISRPDVALFCWEIHSLADNSTRGMEKCDWHYFKELPADAAFTIEQHPGLATTPAYPWNKIYSREFLLRAAIRFPDFRLQEDVQFHWECLLKARTIECIHEILVCHNTGAATSATSSTGTKRLVCIDALRACHSALEPALAAKPAMRFYWNAFRLYLLSYYKSIEKGGVLRAFEHELRDVCKSIPAREGMDIANFYRTGNPCRNASHTWAVRNVQKWTLEALLGTGWWREFAAPGEKLLSIVVPVYNVEDYLELALGCLANQTLANDAYEIIVVDDKSTDSSLEIAQRFAAAHPNLHIKVIPLAENTPGGCAAPSNIGIDAACGRFVGFLDSDDLVALDAYEKLLALALYTDSDISCAGFMSFTDGLPFRYPPYDDKPWRSAVSAFMWNLPTLQSQLLGLCSPVPWRKMYRRSFLEEHSIRYPVGDYFFEDNPFHWFTLSLTDKICCVDEYYFAHRCARPGATTFGQEAKRLAMAEHIESVANHLVRNGIAREMAPAFLQWATAQCAWVALSWPAYSDEQKSAFVRKTGASFKAAVSLDDFPAWIARFSPSEKDGKLAQTLLSDDPDERVFAAFARFATATQIADASNKNPLVDDSDIGPLETHRIIRLAAKLEKRLGIEPPADAARRSWVMRTAITIDTLTRRVFPHKNSTARRIAKTLWDKIF